MIFVKVKIQFRTHNFDPDQDPKKSSASCKSGSTTLVYQVEIPNFSLRNADTEPTTGTGITLFLSFYKGRISLFTWTRSANCEGWAEALMQKMPESP
jgi:hypothetical protein